MRIRVVHIENGWDMRRKHDLREGLHAQRLKPGQCLVAFNVAQTMARVIDSEWGVHDYYEDRGFNLERLAEMIKAGFYVDLDIGRHEVVRGVHLRAA